MLERKTLKNLTEQVEVLIKQVGLFALEKQRQAKIEVDKGGGDYSTNVDVECERLVCDGLGRLDHKFPIYTEEENQKPDADIYWVVDPIDGTRNYFKGLPFWSINIALYDNKNQDVLVGVVFFPKLADLFSACKDAGAKLNGQIIHPSDTDDLSKTTIYAELPNNKSSDEVFTNFTSLLKKAYRVRGWGVAAAACYTASGAFDAHIDFSGTTKPFDILAPYSIAKEAGCLVDDLHNLNNNPNGFVISNGKFSLNI